MFPIMKHVDSLRRARRSIRELILAYRIARVRVRRETDRIHLLEYERALERLVVELARQTGPLEDDPHASAKWLAVGTARGDDAVLDAMEALELRMSDALGSIRSHDSVEVRALVERSLCASEVRRSWLHSRRQDRAA
jgi:hypothetical protein